MAACTAAVAAFLIARLTAWPPHEDETLALFVGGRPLGEVLDTVLEERRRRALSVRRHGRPLGGGLTALRIVSAVFAVASIPLIAALASRLADRATALAATVVASAGWVLLFHGVYGRMYSLFLFTSALSYLALLWALDHGRVAVRALGPRRDRVRGESSGHGALVLASQGIYVLAARKRLAAAFAAFAVVAWSGSRSGWPTFAWPTGSTSASPVPGTKLGAPLPVLEYLTEVAGDFSIGWWPLRAAILVLFLAGCVACSGADVAAALRSCSAPWQRRRSRCCSRDSGSSASPESRHLIFVLPFFATAIGAAVVAAARRWGPSIAVFALLAIVVGEVAWAYDKTRSSSPRSARAHGRTRRGRRVARRDVAARRHLLRVRARLPARVGKRPVSRRHRHPEGRREAGRIAAERPAATARSRRLGLRRLRHQQLSLHTAPDDRRTVAVSLRGLRGEGVRSVPDRAHARADAVTAAVPRRRCTGDDRGQVARDRRRGHQLRHRPPRGRPTPVPGY